MGSLIRGPSCAKFQVLAVLLLAMPLYPQDTDPYVYSALVHCARRPNVGFQTPSPEPEPTVRLPSRVAF